MTKTFSFAPMTQKDVTRVMEIEKHIYFYPWTPGIFRDCIEVGYDCWMLLCDSELQAYGVMSMGVEEAHLLNLSVAASSQGKGRGTRMLMHFLDIARQRGAKTVYLEVRPSNTIAVGLYRKMGFEQVGLRKRYYPAEHGREDAIVFAKKLD